MTEADLNHDIGKSLTLYYKIPDDGSSVGIGGKRPFDGFGALNGRPVFWEAKLLKSFESFNFKKLKSHQIQNLIDYKKEIPNAFCLFVIGVIVSPRKVRLYVWSSLNDLLEIQKRKEEKNNIKAKELLTLTNYIEKTKGTFNFTEGINNGLL